MLILSAAIRSTVDCGMPGYGDETPFIARGNEPPSAALRMTYFGLSNAHTPYRSTIGRVTWYTDSPSILKTMLSDAQSTEYTCQDVASVGFRKRGRLTSGVSPK